MSSFDALAPAAAESASDAEFVPLRPPGARESSVAAEWRPLFAEAEGAATDAGGAAADGQRDAMEPHGAAAASAGGPGPGANGSAGAGEGLRAEYERGRREARAEVEAAATALVRSLEGLAAFRDSLRHRYERELLELAVRVAEKMLRSELRERPDAWLDMIRDGVRQAVDREHVRVRVPVALATFLRERLPDLQARLEDVKELEIVEDPALDAEGCVIETGFGELDLGVAAQSEQVRRGLVQES